MATRKQADKDRQEDLEAFQAVRPSKQEEEQAFVWCERKFPTGIPSWRRLKQIALTTAKGSGVEMTATAFYWIFPVVRGDVLTLAFALWDFVENERRWASRTYDCMFDRARRRLENA